MLLRLREVGVKKAGASLTALVGFGPNLWLSMNTVAYPQYLINATEDRLDGVRCMNLSPFNKTKLVVVTGLPALLRCVAVTGKRYLSAVKTGSY